MLLKCNKIVKISSMTITIKTDFINEEEIKKSRFICHLKRISSEEEARDFIAKIKKKNTGKPIITARPIH